MKVAGVGPVGLTAPSPGAGTRRVAGLASVTGLGLGASACGTAEAGTTARATAADTLLAVEPDTSEPASTPRR